MESTGVDWIPLYQILEQRGFEVYLVNAHYLKSVPGRKSNVSDCQWIQVSALSWLTAGQLPTTRCHLRRTQFVAASQQSAADGF
jgi:transposase